MIKKLRFLNGIFAIICLCFSVSMTMGNHPVDGYWWLVIAGMFVANFKLLKTNG